MKLKSHRWSDFSTREFADLDMSEIVAVLPVAAIEQHGPHLPVSVDAAINAGIVERAIALMPETLPVLVLPAMPVGKSNEHIAFPGTLTLSYETLARLWFEIGESVHRAGCRKLVFINSHGGQINVMDIVCRELRVQLGMFAVSCTWSRLIDTSDLIEASERRHGIHGGQIETSVMMHLQPDAVNMQYAKNFVPRSVQMEESGQILTPEGRVGFGWETQDIQADGACGNASIADADTGKVLVERAAERIVALLQEVADYPLTNIVERSNHFRV